MKRGCVISTLAAFVSIGAPTSAWAESKVYLVEYKFNDPTMRRMNLDGSGVEPIAGVPTTDWLLVGLAVDPVNNHLYWLHGSSGQGLIRRGPLGLNVSNHTLLVAGQRNARGLAIDVAGGKMYWADTQDDVIRRANLDGTTIETLASGSQPGRPALDLASGKVYYGDFTQHVIRRMNLDGSGNEIVVTTGVDIAHGIALDTANNKIYWVDSQTVTNYVARANLDDTGFEALVSYPVASSGLVNIELDLAGGKMYWCDEITASEKGVWRADLNGSNAVRIWASPTGWNAGGIALVLDATPPCDPADANCDGSVSLADIPDFVDVLLGSGSGCSPCQGDTNGDQSADGIDVWSFVDRLIGP